MMRVASIMWWGCLIRWRVTSKNIRAEAENGFLTRLDNITIEDLCAGQENAGTKGFGFTF